MRFRSAAQTLAASLLGALGLLALLEGAIALALRTPPGSGPEGFERARRAYYMERERQIVQYQPDCAEYDPELGYRLRPGRCRFRNREFDTELEINSAGLRDSETSLEAPRIVLAGDSFAMGWGVGQGETVGAQLEARTGQRTLEVAVSSWDTARQLLALGRVDLSAAHTLVVQYCENDFIENRQLALGRGRLPSMSRAEYEATVERHRAAIRYHPGKHLLRFAPLWWRGAPAPGPLRDCALDAEAFLAALAWVEPPPLPPGRSLRLLVFEGLYSLDRPACFAAELAERATRARLPGWVGGIAVIDSSRLLEPADYFPLDEHWRPSGHARLAEALARQLAGAQATSE